MSLVTSGMKAKRRVAVDQMESKFCGNVIMVNICTRLKEGNKEI